LLPAEGISFASFHSFQGIAELKNPALSLGPSRGRSFAAKGVTDKKTTAARGIEVHKGLGDNRGSVDN
jgi:hypothetical protein